MSTTEAVRKGFSPTPSLELSSRVTVGVEQSVPVGTTAVGVPVASRGDVRMDLGVDRSRLEASGFDATVGATLVVPTPDGPTIVAVGVFFVAWYLLGIPLGPGYPVEL